MRHALMDPGFPDLVREWAADEAEEWLDPSFLETVDNSNVADDLADRSSSPRPSPTSPKRETGSLKKPPESIGSPGL